MEFMYATEKNYKICEQIIGIFHENEVSVSQAYAILDYAKRKIAHDTMDKKKAKKSIEEFRDSFASAVFYGDSPATKDDIRVLVDRISNLAEKLLDAISN